MIRVSDFQSVRAAVMESVARRDPDIFFDRRIVVAAPTNLDDLNSRRFLGNLHGANPHHYRALQGGIDCTHDLPAITCRRLSYGPVGSLAKRPYVPQTEAPDKPDLRALQRLAHDTASHGSL